MKKKITFFQKHKKTLIIVTVITVLIFGRQALSAKDSKPPKGKTEKTVIVKKQDLKKELKLSGIVEAEESVTLRFQGSGLLNWVGVKEGDSVKKWQALASLDQRSLQQNLKKELNDYLSERWDFEQTQEDYEGTKEKHLISDAMQRILDKAQFDLESSVIDYELADLAVKLATLTTPIDGIVTLVEQPHSGVNITPAISEIQIVNPKTIYFSAEVDEEEVALIKEGLSSTITIDSYPEEEIPSQITYISLRPISTGTSISYEIKLELPGDNQELKYRLNMSGDARINLDEKRDVLTISVKYLNEEKDRAFVLLKTEDEIKEQNVKLGLETDTKVEILEGLKEGDEIIYYE